MPRNVLDHVQWSTRLLALAAIAASADASAADAPPVPAEPVDAIVVTARKLTVESLIDRTVYSVATDVQAAFGTVSDVLSAIPSVDVSPEGSVSLRGDGNVLILVDGKPSAQLSGAAAGDNLQSMPSRDIERIEVITTPPAQFKADGAAGIINIITRKNRPSGVSGSVQGSLGNQGRSVVGASASYSASHLTASVTAGFRHDLRERKLTSTEQAVDPVSGQVLSSTSSLNERLRRQVPTVGASADYAIDERQTLTAAFNWSHRGGLRTYTQFDTSNTPAGALTHSTQRTSSGHDPEADIDERLGYARKLALAGELLELSLHRSTSHQQEHYDYVNDSFIPQLQESYSNLGFREDHRTTELEVDYTLPFSKTRSLKLGYAYAQDDYRFANAGYNIDPVSLVQTPDPNVTNNFRFLQQVHSAYGSYQTAVGRWTWLAGARAEATRTDGQQLTDRISNSTSYFRIYPSLHLSRGLTDSTTLSLGASRRISRPDPEALNPYVDREYTPNLRAGNAMLRPQYTQSYEVGYGYEKSGLSWQVTGYYRLNRDGVTDVTTYLGNGLSLTTKANLPKNDSTGLEVAASGHIVSTLGYSVSGNLFQSQIDATALGVPGLQSTSGLNAKVKLDYRPTASDSVQFTITRSDKRLTPQGYISAINILNAGYRHQFETGLTVVVTASDIFNGQRYERVANTPTLTSDYQRSVQGRILFVGVVYSFGSSKKDKAASFDYDKGD
ncbi:MAG: hypothetical protein RL684_1818 [Pseudomonadota bacterium]